MVILDWTPSLKVGLEPLQLSSNDEYGLGEQFPPKNRELPTQDWFQKIEIENHSLVLWTHLEIGSDYQSGS